MMDRSEFTRRQGRWVRKDELERKAKDLGEHARKPLPGEPRRRVNGRWLPVGNVDSRHGVLRAVARRFWLLIIPLIGITYANSAYVRPVVSEYESRANQHRKVVLDEKDRLLQMTSALQTRIQEVSSEIDTLYAPEIAYYQSIHDDVMRQYNDFQRSEKVTQKDLDSLRAERDRVRAEARALQNEYRNHASILENLQAFEGALHDSLMQRERQLAANQVVEEESEGGISLKTVVRNAGFVVAPVLGFLWAHGS